MSCVEVENMLVGNTANELSISSLLLLLLLLLLLVLLLLLLLFVFSVIVKGKHSSKMVDITPPRSSDSNFTPMTAELDSTSVTS